MALKNNSGCSAVGAHLVRDQGVAGSNPVTPIFDRIMKKIIILLLPFIFTQLFAYEISVLPNNITLVYENESNAYDYVSIMINAGYYNAGNRIDDIIGIYTSDITSGNFDYIVMPLYTIINYYISSMQAQYLLMNILNIDADIINGHIPYTPSILSDKALKLRMRFNGNLDTNTRILAVTVKSNSPLKQIRETCKAYPHVEPYSSYIPMLMDTYHIDGLKEPVKFYDFPINSEFALNDALFFYYYKLRNNENTYIRYTHNKAIVITGESLEDEPDMDEFRAIKNDIELFYDNSRNDVFFNTIFQPYLLFSSKMKYFDGLNEKARHTTFPEFISIKNKEPNCVFLPLEIENKDIKADVIEMDNGITLLYMNSSEYMSEISVLIRNVLENEYYYSKPYASDIIFSSIFSEEDKWVFLPYSLISEFRIITGTFNDNEVNSEMERIFSQMQLNSVDYNRAIVSEYADFAQTYPIESIADDYIHSRLASNREALYLTNGELDVLRKKIFNPSNIIISINTSLSKEKVMEMILQILETDIEYSAPAMSYKPLKTESEEFIIRNQWSEDTEAADILAGYLNYPSTITISRDFVVMKGSMFRNIKQYKSNLYFNLMNRNGFTIIPALSYHLFGDYNKCFKILGIH